MFLSAVARPRPGFDSKLGIWRLAENYSVLHCEARFEKPQQGREELDNVVRPQLLQDDASAGLSVHHRGLSKAPNIKHIRDMCASSRMGRGPTRARMYWTHEQYRSEAHARKYGGHRAGAYPDMNVNYLGLFRALDMAVYTGPPQRHEARKDGFAAAILYSNGCRGNVCGIR